MFSRVLAALTLVACVQCGGSPAAPTPVPSAVPPAPASPPAPFAGVALDGHWSLMLDRSGCGVPCYGSLSIDVAHIGDAYAAIAWVDPIGALDLSGLMQADGFVSLSGSRPQTGAGPGIDLSLRVAPDPVAGLKGTVTVQSAGSPEYTSAIRSASLTRTPAETSSLEGTWQGTGVIRTCTGYCPIFQTVGTAVRTTLVLGMSGNSVSGRGLFSFGPSGWIPVDGTVSGGTATLKSIAFQFVEFANPRSMQVERLTLSMDAGGRLQGSAQYYAEPFVYSGSSGSYQSYRVTADFTSTRLVP